MFKHSNDLFQQMFSCHVKAEKTILEKSKTNNPGCQIMPPVLLLFGTAIYYSAAPAAQSSLMKLHLWDNLLRTEG